MVQRLIQHHLMLRGGIYYFRYVLPVHIKILCPNLPSEIRRSLRTDSYSAALALSVQKLPIINLLQKSKDSESIKRLFYDIADFSQKLIFVDAPKTEYTRTALSLSEAWLAFTKWKNWTDKQEKANQRIFNNIVFFVGDISVDRVTKAHIRTALASISRLPQRNKKNYSQAPIEQLVRMDIPKDDVVSGKYVKEHLKLCQSLFSRYLKSEVDVLLISPTEGLRYEYKDNRYASLNDDQVRTVLVKSQNKPDWFKWFMLLSVYSGARRSELAGLKKSDFKYCTDSNRYYFQISHGKTKTAIRAVPLHHKLIESGLLKWIASRCK